MIVSIGTNKQGDTVSVITNGTEDLILNYSYWDCDCAHQFVKPMKLYHCTECGADRDDSDISEELDVQVLVYQFIQ